MICKNCNGLIRQTNTEYLCFDCGLTSNELLINDEIIYNDEIQSQTKHKITNLYKNRNWYILTNEELNTYKLVVYIKQLCNRLHLIDNLTEQVVNVSVTTMKIIQQFDCNKRTRVKDGIIIVCIQYASNNNYNAIKLCKEINLPIKYITRAEQLIHELVNNDKLKLDKKILLELPNPVLFVEMIINNYNLHIKSQKNILQSIKILVDICENNNILLNHTPLSIGACCFYYITQLNSENIINIELFSEMFKLSTTTIKKSYMKLLQFDDLIKEYI